MVRPSARPLQLRSLALLYRLGVRLQHLLVRRHAPARLHQFLLLRLQGRLRRHLVQRGLRRDQTLRLVQHWVLHWRLVHHLRGVLAHEQRVVAPALLPFVRSRLLRQLLVVPLQFEHRPGATHRQHARPILHHA